MDEHVGKIVGKLRDDGLLERTLVILAGDHGEAFGEKEETGHGVFLYEPTMRVPLILYAENRLPRGRITVITGVLHRRGVKKLGPSLTLLYYSQ